MRIKVLHIIKSLGRGGAEVLLPETLALHDQNKFEFHYVYFLPWKDQMVDIIKKHGGKVSCITANNNLQLIQKLDEVVRYCNKEKIDIIHCHLPWSGFLGRRVFSKTKIPVVYTEHNIQERYHWATKLVNKYTFNFQSMALGVSNDVTESIKKNIVPKIPVETVLNGVNTNNFQRDIGKGKSLKQRLGIPEDSFVLGNIAVFREQKKLLDWIRAFNAIHKEYPDVYGILVGAGPKEKEIKDIVDELNLTEKIVFPGLQEDTIPYFSVMDVFMLSSAFEGLPIALLEAMSMKCAVVSTKAGGVVEVVRHDKEGLLCEPGDWEMLAENVKKLIQHPEKRVKIQELARERVLQNFSLLEMVRSLEQKYFKIYNGN
ncbi:glycosyltransferase [Autumnicola edwardsiae]|uniref:Glycosyltransferase n=1 Tax=Autumnicola edwardsiae TaxID=3075594 RepID=A0ABU3CTS9_9FLAO|nr:glycosyltransferase [Zunongwangia sp. F297]MDT0649633.1 glycosyltransferase [Zunongwangia sp. F297]